ncbi:hypothetical protein ACKXGF_00140 [Alkalibacillus sp. S2W]|uniref:hypothetical protein n=1 Tax=Alkalibacillus sp. S2W TaxID=3386553 RepID=UPI00398CF5D5
MKTFEEQLIEKKYLTPHLTEGPKRVKSKSSIKLMDAFITNRFAKEDDFYMQVARTWVEGYEKKLHKSSLLISFLFVMLWLIFIFLNQYMTTIIEGIYYLILFFLPIIGFFIALMGRGWKIAGLTMLNFTLLLVAMITYL